MVVIIKSTFQNTTCKVAGMRHAKADLDAELSGCNLPSCHFLLRAALLRWVD